MNDRNLKVLKSVTGNDIRDTQGTIFSLPLRTEAKPETILGRFRRLLPVLMAFTQRIHKCHLRGLFPETKTTEWSEKVLPHGLTYAELSIGTTMSSARAG